MLCPRTTPARPGGNATPLPAVCSLAPRRNRRFRKSADRGLWVSMLPAGHCLECALFVLAGELLQRVGCAVISHESEAERMERGKGVSQQPTLGRRILGTRTAHPYRFSVARHLRAGREPLRRVRVFGSITTQAPKKVRRPCRDRSTETHHHFCRDGLLLKVCDARQYTSRESAAAPAHRRAGCGQ